MQLSLGTPEKLSYGLEAMMSGRASCVAILLRLPPLDGGAQASLWLPLPLPQRETLRPPVCRAVGPLLKYLSSVIPGARPAISAAAGMASAGAVYQSNKASRYDDESEAQAKGVRQELALTQMLVSSGELAKYSLRGAARASQAAAFGDAESRPKTPTGADVPAEDPTCASWIELSQADVSYGRGAHGCALWVEITLRVYNPTPLPLVLLRGSAELRLTDMHTVGESRSSSTSHASHSLPTPPHIRPSTPLSPSSHATWPVPD